VGNAEYVHILWTRRMDWSPSTEIKETRKAKRFDVDLS
jgi:hypothetical protein